MMKNIVLVFVLFAHVAYSQTAEDFLIEVEEIQINNSPGVHAFVHAEHDNKWLIIGGRTDGLHQRQPFAAFLASDNNVEAFVVDPVNDQTHSVNLSVLPIGIYEQLQSTNMEFEQRDSMLYIIGGYGYSAVANDHITYPNLTAVDVPGLMGAIINNTSILPYFRQITDNRLQVTGGYLDRIDDLYFLAGGQMFEGRYNPMGPTHGPGFTQEYTNAIKTFTIADDGINLTIGSYNEWIDTANLHRRDYNMSIQIFPTGDTGLTMFSGVFQYTADIPWLNTVDVLDTGYAVRNTFNQYLNQYHTGHMPVFDGANNAMHTVFFGGMSRYTLDQNNQLVDDPDVPFVNTISKVTRYSDNTMDEFKVGEMQGLLGFRVRSLYRCNFRILLTHMIWFSWIVCLIPKHWLVILLEVSKVPRKIYSLLTMEHKAKPLPEFLRCTLPGVQIQRFPN